MSLSFLIWEMGRTSLNIIQMFQWFIKLIDGKEPVRSLPGTLGNMDSSSPLCTHSPSPTFPPPHQPHETQSENKSNNQCGLLNTGHPDCRLYRVLFILSSGNVYLCCFQAWAILWRTQLWTFLCSYRTYRQVCFIILHRYCTFYKLKISGKHTPALLVPFFQVGICPAFVHLVPVSHFGIF